MITINLLPDEYNRSKRAPLKMLAATAIAVTANMLLATWVAWTFFGVRTEVEGELEVTRDDMAALDPQVKYHKELEKENKLYRSREKTLDDITSNRITWTQKLDQLIDVVNTGGDGEKYLIWLDDLAVTQRTSRGKIPKGQTPAIGNLRSSGHSGSPNYGLVANFFEDLSTSEFAEGFFPPGPPEGKVSTADPDLIPSEIFSFTLDLDIAGPTAGKK